MKISELMERLEYHKNKYGDIDVHRSNSGDNGYRYNINVIKYISLQDYRNNMVYEEEEYISLE